ncbi:MAG: biotin/lipoyl-binding protein [Verrucomicrobia bacterium]|nr:biotin/lipoyl-binding protein [Verrucomicrobiota bacterium]
MLVLSGCGRKHDATGADDTVRPVRMMQVAASDTEALRFATVIRSSRSVDLAFPVPGQLIQLPVLDGSLVSEGQVLGQLDARDFELRVESARAAYNLAEADFRRFEQLAQSGAVSPANRDQARAKIFDCQSHA